MNNKIKLVSEAFSMQPIIYRVGMNGIAKIEAETVCIGREYGDPIEQARLVGYNREGQELFSLVALAHNIQFETTKNGTQGN